MNAAWLRRAAIVLIFTTCNFWFAGAALSDEQALDSYEYKLMLQPEGFLESRRDESIVALWNKDIAESLSAVSGAEASGTSFFPEKDRAVRFWDNESCLLLRHGYAFRERVKIKDGDERKDKRKVTLKYRNEERATAAAKDLSSKESGKSKFERDVTAGREPNSPPRSIYSKSTTQTIKSGKKLNRLDDPLGLYPALAADLEAQGAEFDEDAPLSVVADLTVREQVYEGPLASLGEQGAAFSLTLWFDSEAGSLDRPLLAELSFKVENAAGQAADAEVLARAERLFEALLDLPQRDASACTKTRSLYAGATSCNLDIHCDGE
ncbi:MAG: hypothetical protein RIC87_23420 [Kiloniellales bacterium]